MVAESHVTHFFPPPYGISFTPLDKKGIKYILSVDKGIFEFIIEKIIVITLGLYCLFNSMSIFKFIYLKRLGFCFINNIMRRIFNVLLKLIRFINFKY